MKLSITIELSSIDQLVALQNALENHIDMETDRGRDGKAAGFEKRDGELLAAAKQVQSMLNGKAR